MSIVMVAQRAERTVTIINVARHMEIAVHLNGAVVLQLQEAAGTMKQPKLTGWRRRRCGLV